MFAGRLVRYSVLLASILVVRTLYQRTSVFVLTFVVGMEEQPHPPYVVWKNYVKYVKTTTGDTIGNMMETL